MNSMRCLIVDDEPLAISTLRRLLAERSEIEIVGEAHSVATAREACLTLRPDLMLLDIQLGDGSGFDILAGMEQPPAVIFTTAYNQHAVRAFEVNALDYLMKPVEEERLFEALERAERRAMLTVVQSAASVTGRSDDPRLIEVGSTGRFVAPESISFIQSEDKYTRVHLSNGGELLTQTSLTDWQRKLESYGFLRLDRRWLVCLSVIGSVEFLGREAQVQIRQPTLHITVGRTGATRLRRALRDSGDLG